MTLTPLEFAHLYLYGNKDEFQDPKTWQLGPSFGHWDKCKRLVALVKARDQEQSGEIALLRHERQQIAAKCVAVEAELATALAQKRAADNENLQLRAQLDPDGPAQALTQVVGMQTFTTKPGQPARKYVICNLCKHWDLPHRAFCSACMGAGVVPE